MYIRFWTFNFDLILVQRTQSVLRIFALSFVQTCLEQLEAARSEKKMCHFFFLAKVNAWLLLTSLKACDWPKHIFGASASPTKVLNKKKGRCHPLPLLFMAVSNYTRWSEVYDIRVAIIACGIRGWRNLGFYAWTSSHIICITFLSKVVSLASNFVAERVSGARVGN